jgi:hypothetical protein
MNPLLASTFEYEDYLREKSRGLADDGVKKRAGYRDEGNQSFFIVRNHTLCSRVEFSLNC